MKKFLALLLILVGATSPVFAINNATGTGSTPVIVFRGHAQRTLEVDYAPASAFNGAVDDIYDFSPSNGDNNASDYLNSGTGYTLSPVSPPAPPVLPNPLGFQLAVAQDTTIPVASLLEFCKYAGVIGQTTSQTLPVLQALWATAKVNDSAFSGNCTDGTPITTKIEGYAATFNMPLQ
ncbi:MAG TPA: hypothetical protein V6C86_24120 [Oculatellaceae cyanobacterium]